MKSKKKITPNSKAMELNAMLNEVGGAVPLKWKYDWEKKKWFVKSLLHPKVTVEHSCYGWNLLYDGNVNQNGNTKLNLYFKSVLSAKIVAQLIYNG